MTETFEIIRSLFKLVFKILFGATLVTFLSKVFKFRLALNISEFEVAIKDGAFQLEHKNEDYAKCVFYFLNLNKGFQLFSFSGGNSEEDEGKEISPEMIKVVRLFVAPIRIFKGPEIVNSLNQAILKMEEMLSGEGLDSEQRSSYNKKLEHCQLAIKLFA